MTTEQQFVSYETDLYRRAHAWAREQMARKYPGSVEAMEAEQSLINQFLQAHKKA